MPSSGSPAVRTELDHARVARAIGVVDVEAAVLRVVRVERHREQPLLRPVGADAAANVHEEAPFALLEHEDAARLLDDVEARGLGRRCGHVHGRIEAAGDADDAQLLPLGTRPGDGRNGNQQQREALAPEQCVT